MCVYTACNNSSAYNSMYVETASGQLSKFPSDHHSALVSSDQGMLRDTLAVPFGRSNMVIGVRQREPSLPNRYFMSRYVTSGRAGGEHEKDEPEIAIFEAHLASASLSSFFSYGACCTCRRSQCCAEIKLSRGVWNWLNRSNRWRYSVKRALF